MAEPRTCIVVVNPASKCKPPRVRGRVTCRSPYEDRTGASGVRDGTVRRGSDSRAIDDVRGWLHNLDMKNPDKETARGSRRHVLDWMEAPDFTNELLTLCAIPGVSRSARGQHFPRGWKEAEEARLERHGAKLLPDSQPAKFWNELAGWWLTNRGGANTPNWDIAMPVDVDGRPGLLLVEAKANLPELGTGGKPEASEFTGKGEKQERRSDKSIEASKGNHARIKIAIDQAREGLAALGAVTAIDRDTHYQLSNRLAFAWWLASKGVPLVLLYLGFTKDEGIEGFFESESSWNDAVREYFEGVGADALLDSRLDVRGTPLWVLSRSKDVLRHSPWKPVPRTAGVDPLYTHASLSKVPKLQVRFTNFPEPRKKRLSNDKTINFIKFREPMTEAQAAEWLALHPDCDSDDWRSALSDLRARVQRRPAKA